VNTNSNATTIADSRKIELNAVQWWCEAGARAPAGKGCPSLNSGALAMPLQPKKNSGATTDAETGNICMFLWRHWRFTAKGILSSVCL